MYSFEIDELLKNENYNIDSQTYLHIINSSPQINHIIYKPFGGYYEMQSNDGYEWEFKVYKNNQ